MKNNFENRKNKIDSQCQQRSTVKSLFQQPFLKEILVGISEDGKLSPLPAAFPAASPYVSAPLPLPPGFFSLCVVKTVLVVSPGLTNRALGANRATSFSPQGKRLDQGETSIPGYDIYPNTFFFFSHITPLHISAI